MANVKQLLEAVGSQLDQVCKIVIYVTHIDYRDVAYPAVGRWLRGVYQVSTGIVFSGLGHQEWRLKWSVTAVVMDGS